MKTKCVVYRPFALIKIQFIKLNYVKFLDDISINYNYPNYNHNRKYNCVLLKFF